MDDKEASRPWLVWAALVALSVALIGTLAAGPAPSQALSPLNVTATKAVDRLSVEPGDTPAPLYTVTFSNSYTEAVELDAITDTLPAGFMFSGMHASSDWLQPPDDGVGPEIVWQGPITVPAGDSLSLVYAVYVPAGVPPSSIPYQNTVVADAGGQLVGPASAWLYVGAPSLSMQKSAQPARVLIGEPVEYTLSVANSGQVTGTVAVISDTLDPSLTFVGMSAGSEVPAPVEVSGTLVWTGPFTVPVGDDLLVKYEASTSGGPGWSWPCNRAEAWAEGALLGPVQACVEVGPAQGLTFLPTVYKGIKWPYFTIGKGVAPDTLMAIPGAVVTYDIIVHNEGDLAGVLGSVVDTLPAGFTFVEMVPGSDVMANPSGMSGTITWNGPFNVAGGGQLRVIFNAAINQTPGVYVNWANATALVGHAPWTPASATVTVEPGVLFEEHFDDGISRWTKFLNYWRLTEEQWYWDSDDGVGNSGAADHRCCDNPKKEAEDAVLMYLGEGAEQWTDYRVEAKFNFREGAGPVGLWVRGQWEPSDIRAQWMTGYYIVAGGRATSETKFVKITQLQTATDCWAAACDNPENLYNFNNTHEMVSVSLAGPLTRGTWHTMAVEVRGARILVWLDGELAIDWTDPKEPFLTGTVGFKTYKAEWISFDDVVVTPLN